MALELIDIVFVFNIKVTDEMGLGSLMGHFLRRREPDTCQKHAVAAKFFSYKIPNSCYMYVSISHRNKPVHSSCIAL